MASADVAPDGGAEEQEAADHQPGRQPGQPRPNGQGDGPSNGAGVTHYQNSTPPPTGLGSPCIARAMAMIVAGMPSIFDRDFRR